MADHGVRTELCYTLPGVSTEEEAMAFLDHLIAAGITEITWRPTEVRLVNAKGEVLSQAPWRPDLKGVQ